MSFARDTLLIFRRQMRLSLRNPAWVIIGLVQPILYLVFFGPLLTQVARGGLPGFPAGNAYSFFVPGMLIQMGLFGAAFVGFTIIADWRVGVVERLRVTPVSRLAILAGRLLRDVLTLLVQAVVLVLVGLAFGMRAPVAGVLIGFGLRRGGSGQPGRRLLHGGPADQERGRAGAAAQHGGGADHAAVGHPAADDAGAGLAAGDRPGHAVPLHHRRDARGLRGATTPTRS
jgi:hypothetical protein